MPEEKKKRSRPDSSAQPPPGTNHKFLSNSREVAALPDIDSNNVVEVKKRIEEYFTICDKNDVKPSIAGLALAFGVDRATLLRWRTGELHKPPEVRTTLKKAVSLLNSQMEDYMQNGLINPVSGIFLMKNNMDYTDKKEVVLKPQESEASPEALLSEVENLPEITDGN